MVREARYLADRLRPATGLPLEIISDPGNAADADIRLELVDDRPDLGPEGYRLLVDATGVRLGAPAAAGIFYGLQTLRQMFPAALESQGPRKDIPWTLPGVTVEDSPRFRWRGAMLDCSRHFRPVPFIRKFLDLLALHKLNVFHWHLTDDQGWRIEIKKYPRLTEFGGWRRETWRGHAWTDSEGDGVRHGGFYTQEEIRALVQYAADRHITIVPEIEMPGHAQAAVAAYPELGCTPEKLEVWTRWGISPNIFHPREETILFLQDVLSEVIDLFPGPFVHIGGDEAIKTQWDASAEIRALMPKVGVADSHELQSYFIRRMDRFLSARGKRLIGWEEILEGGLAEGAALMSWKGIEAGVTAAKLGHDVVMAPKEHTYFDHYQSRDIGDEPPAYGGFVSLEQTYHYEPMPVGLEPAQERHILGLQGQLWAEYMATGDQVEYMAFPRLAALAEVAWSAREHRHYGSFLDRLRKHLKRLDIMGVKYRPLDDPSKSGARPS